MRKTKNRRTSVDYFKPDELLHLKGRDVVPFASNWRIEDMIEDKYDDVEVYAYRNTVAALNDRMNIFGITTELAGRVFKEILAEKIRENTECAQTSGFEGFSQKYLEENKYLESLTYEKWFGLKHTRRVFDSDSAMDDPFAIFRYHDDSFLLRMIIDQLPLEDVIALDLSDVYEDGWVTERNPEILSSTEEAYAKSASPPIIITEGIFDVYAIESAISILKPHLSGFITFLDFGQNNDGGVSAVVRLLKSLAAARIENRVLALFDNDTAAHEELVSLVKNCHPSDSYPVVSPALLML